MLSFHLWQETSKKLLESCDISVYIFKSNRCPWPYLTELRLSWQAGPVLADPSCHCQWAGAGPGTIQTLMRIYPRFIKADSYPRNLAQPSGQPGHTAATVGATPELVVNSRVFVLAASCCDFAVVPKEIKSVQAGSDLLPSRSIDTQLAWRSTFL